MAGYKKERIKAAKKAASKAAIIGGALEGVNYIDNEMIDANNRAKNNSLTENNFSREIKHARGTKGKDDYETLFSGPKRAETSKSRSIILTRGKKKKK